MRYSVSQNPTFLMRQVFELPLIAARVATDCYWALSERRDSTLKASTVQRAGLPSLPSHCAYITTLKLTRMS